MRPEGPLYTMFIPFSALLGMQLNYYNLRAAIDCILFLCRKIF